MTTIASEKSAPRCPFERREGVYSYLGNAHLEPTHFIKGRPLNIFKGMFATQNWKIFKIKRLLNANLVPPLWSPAKTRPFNISSIYMYCLIKTFLLWNDNLAKTHQPPSNIYHIDLTKYRHNNEPGALCQVQAPIGRKGWLRRWRTTSQPVPPPVCKTIRLPITISTDSKLQDIKTFNPNMK